MCRINKDKFLELYDDVIEAVDNSYFDSYEVLNKAIDSYNERYQYEGYFTNDDIRARLVELSGLYETSEKSVDVLINYITISDSDCQKVLKYLLENSDANEGISWDDLDNSINELLETNQITYTINKP